MADELISGRLSIEEELRKGASATTYRATISGQGTDDPQLPSGDRTNAFGKAYLGFNVNLFGTYTVIISKVQIGAQLIGLSAGSGTSGQVVVGAGCMQN